MMERETHLGNPGGTVFILIFKLPHEIKDHHSIIKYVTLKSKNKLFKPNQWQNKNSHFMELLAFGQTRTLRSNWMTR